MENIETEVGGNQFDFIDAEDAVDYTNLDYHRADSVRLTNGIDLDDLRADGIVFSPEFEDSVFSEESQRNFFSNNIEELENLMRGSSLSNNNKCDMSDEDSLDDFESARITMTDVSGDGGVMKKVIKEGLQTVGDVPENAVVKIHYSMHLEGQDESYDSSYMRGKPEKYKIGEGQLIVGLETGIRSMKKREYSHFLIDPNYAFGKFGCPPRIPGDAQIFAKVELLDFAEDGKAEAMLSMTTDDRSKKYSFDEVLKEADVEIKGGNNAVRNSEWKIAIRHYERGVRLLEEINLANVDQELRSRKLLLKLYLNSAHCYLKVQWPKKACIACKGALEIEENTKALFRFGKAKRMLEDFESAKSLLKKAHRKAPNDRHINDELTSLEDQLVRDKEKESILCKNMFGNIKSKAKEKIEQRVYDGVFSELKEFADQDEAEMFIGKDQMNLQQIKAIKLAASNLELFVREDDARGKGVLIVSKVNKKHIK